eukprot:1156404-Pelagomonas_calceolata.AAC.4
MKLLTKRKAKDCIKERERNVRPSLCQNSKVALTGARKSKNMGDVKEAKTVRLTDRQHLSRRADFVVENL